VEVRGRKAQHQQEMQLWMTVWGAHLEGAGRKVISQELWEALEAGEGREWTLPSDLQKGTQPGITLILVLRPPVSDHYRKYICA
jgi:hypothetical protein